MRVETREKLIDGFKGIAEYFDNNMVYQGHVTLYYVTEKGMSVCDKHGHEVAFIKGSEFKRILEEINGGNNDSL